MSAAILSLVEDPDAARPALRDVVQCLRNVADNIEAGIHGEVLRAAVVLRSEGREPIVCCMGDGSFPQIFMDLHAGAAQLMSMAAPVRS